MPSPLEPATISLLLQYIVPPSQLTDPIPSHLISKNLLNRHFFLNLRDPSSDPASYLSWPSPDRQKVFDILESSSTSLDCILSNLNIHYTGDIDSTFAHAEIPTVDQDLPNIRMVFEWDVEDSSWKYHNLALMPFPTQSFHSVSAITNVGIGASRTNHFNDQTEDESYWDSYGNAGGSQRSPGFLSNAESSEDDYWSQYATVHGTADSTRPTPPPEREQHPESYQEDDLHQLNDFYSRDDPAEGDSRADHNPIIQIPYESFNIKPPHGRNSPPSPEDLTERLRALQSNSSDQPSSAISVNIIPSQEHSVTDNLQKGTELPQEIINGHDDELSQSDETESACGVNVSLNVALRESIRGTYRLWKFSANRNDDGQDKELFLNAVKAAIIDC
ncbi:hypothetical protein E1B28_001116 [Marasmius oreades]|uniref:Uncharacterized protein n=1 Tax=Marasmius oreades TaxID=181124 RepID=A0A9P8AF74_9AGAR|nr:uncharacterized protein E1B28_001116 [Marasmius oreades]KAG7099253.1 hypothetical protein E1B28_001116 [Marasmius oreades]